MRERAQWSRAHALLPKRFGLVLSTVGWLAAICSSSSRGSHTYFWPPKVQARMWCAYIHLGKTLKHKINKLFKIVFEKERKLGLYYFEIM